MRRWGEVPGQGTAVNSVLLSALARLCALALTLGAFVCAGRAAETPPLRDPMEAALERLKEEMKFSEWAVKVKIPGKKVETLPFSAADVEQYAHRIQQRDLGNGKKRKLFLHDESGRQIGRIDLIVCDTPQAAHEVLLAHFEAHFSAPFRFEMAEKGGPFEVGDVCFYPVDSRRLPDGSTSEDNTGKSPPGPVLFSRNNVMVWVSWDPSDLLKIARLVDDKLVQSLAGDGGEQDGGALLGKLKLKYKWAEWGGEVRIEGKSVKALDFTASDFSEYGQVKTKARRGQERKSVTVYITDDSEKSTRVGIAILETPVKVQEVALKSTTIISTRYRYRMAEKASERDVGDVCFYAVDSRRLPDGSTSEEPASSLVFTRNNVLVTIHPGWLGVPDALKLARFIDGRLVESLVGDNREQP